MGFIIICCMKCLATNQKVGGSSPFQRAKNLVMMRLIASISRIIFLFSSALPLPSLDFRRLKPFLELLTSGIHPFCSFLCDSPSAPTVQCKRMSSLFSSPPPFSCIFCSAFYHWRCQKFLTALVENYNRHIPMSLYGIMPVSLFIF